VDQDSDTIDILVQRRRHKKAAERFFCRLIKGQGREPRGLTPDKLKSYDAVHRTMMLTIDHINATYANTRADVSRVRISGMGKTVPLCLQQVKLTGPLLVIVRR
jgi:putative transposase